MKKGLATLAMANIGKGTRVCVRCDYDVAMRNGVIENDYRIRESLSTLKFILRAGGRIRIIAHAGRPEGKRVSALSMSPIMEDLSRMLKKRIVFISDPASAHEWKQYNDSADILFFENIRFWKGEEKNDHGFANMLSRWGDIYVNEAFANCHRNHASMVALPQLLPSYAGLHTEKEVSALLQARENPPHPFIALLGGAKLETKVPVIRRFLKDADGVLVGGAVANALLFMRGFSVGKSMVYGQKKESIPRWVYSKKMHLPCDVAVTDERKSKERDRICAVGDVAKNEYIMDIGPQSIRDFSEQIRKARMIVWNGPLGLAEMDRFAKGTIGVAKAIRDTRAIKIIGGGDTISILEQQGALKGFTHVSTGGGAMLEFLAGKKLPGIEALRKSKFQSSNFKSNQKSKEAF